MRKRGFKAAQEPLPSPFSLLVGTVSLGTSARFDSFEQKERKEAARDGEEGRGENGCFLSFCTVLSTISPPFAPIPP